MRCKRFTNERIDFALRLAENGATADEVCRKRGVSEPTFQRWKKQFVGLGVPEIRRLKQLDAVPVAPSGDEIAVRPPRVARPFDLFLNSGDLKKGPSSETPMPIPYASHIDAPLGIVRPTLRDAALRILAAHGRDLPSGSDTIRYAGVAGLKIFHLTSEPGVIARRGPGNWSTPEGPTPDALQHLIDIDAGAHVLGVGWRGDGIVLHDRFVRGPWEYELLRAAGMTVDIPQISRVAPAGPGRNSRMTWPIEDIVGARRGRLSHTITFDVIGYWTGMPEVASAGLSFTDLVAKVRECHDASRAADGEVDSGTGSTGFGLEAWIGVRPFKGGAPKGRPDLRYWVTPHGGAPTAAALLLLLSRSADMSGRCRPDSVSSC